MYIYVYVVYILEVCTVCVCMYCRCVFYMYVCIGGEYNVCMYVLEVYIYMCICI